MELNIVAFINASMQHCVLSLLPTMKGTLDFYFNQAKIVDVLYNYKLHDMLYKCGNKYF